MACGIDDLWQADLVEMREFADSNEGYNYLLYVIDCFSKFAWIEPLKSKTGVETNKAFERIFEKERIPTNLHFDEGKEFYNEKVKTMLTDGALIITAHFQTKRLP